MPRFRVVLFDFDGTLADSYAAIAASVNHVLASRGRSALEENVIRKLVGHGLLSLMEAVLPDSDPAENAKRYGEHHPSVLASHTFLLPKVREGLEALKQAGLKMGVCSNKPSLFTRPLLDILEITPYFTTVFGPEECGAAKPNPAMIHRSRELMGATAKETLYVGDMLVDIETGRNAGVETWVMPTGSHDELTLQSAKPAQLLPDFDAVVRLVLA